MKKLSFTRKGGSILNNSIAKKKAMNELFEEFLFLSARLRTKYVDSLGERNNNWEKVFYDLYGEIPELFQVIYNKVSGTRRNIADQTLMDFIPGFRLIHICELKEESVKLNRYYNDKIQVIIPFLANYSSDYICYCRTNAGKEYIGSISHDDLMVIQMHKNIKKFFETICAFYQFNVYFLDTDGYLDYDLELEGTIGAEINLGIPYWLE